MRAERPNVKRRCRTSHQQESQTCAGMAPLPPLLYSVWVSHSRRRTPCFGRDSAFAHRCGRDAGRQSRLCRSRSCRGPEARNQGVRIFVRSGGTPRNAAESTGSACARTAGSRPCAEFALAQAAVTRGRPQAQTAVRRSYCARLPAPPADAAPAPSSSGVRHVRRGDGRKRNSRRRRGRQLVDAHGHARGGLPEARDQLPRAWGA